MPAPMAMSAFFAQHAPHYTPKPTTTITTEFTALALQKNWNKNTPLYSQKRGQCLLAELHFQLRRLLREQDGEGTHEGPDGARVQWGYGEASKVEVWRVLCVVCGIEEGDVPLSLTGCRKALARVNVNIVDLVDALRQNRPVRVFPSYQALLKYTFGQKGRTFPLGAAKEDGIVKVLLKTF